MIENKTILNNYYIIFKLLNENIFNVLTLSTYIIMLQTLKCIFTHVILLLSIIILLLTIVEYVL